MTRTLTAIVAALGATGLVAGPALAAEPYAKPDDAWITLSGTVVGVAPSSFTLDYGDGVILVEMDDWDSDADAFGLVDGDTVTVYGEVDQNLFAASTIEAQSVYVQDLNTYFYASSADEEGADTWVTSGPVVVSEARVNGLVTAVTESEQSFVLDVGPGDITVETDLLDYNPLDDKGFQQIEEGDRVSVAGLMDNDFIEGRVLEATSVVTLVDNTPES
ncbi:hypothetical protein [Roseospira goensis]|uniref:Uncharacterized protein YdeI (BOF family) n=1 Tax=Roseospira goensis TaxID=391922 RepID=A0A7W6S1M7_9PROT|nr:hypothetical protein [Roseospira goensis]MBB4286527.1 uncharacterized protein YdeI (BOF family) [Roseospira goensis]